MLQKLLDSILYRKRRRHLKMISHYLRNKVSDCRFDMSHYIYDKGTDHEVLFHELGKYSDFEMSPSCRACVLGYSALIGVGWEYSPYDHWVDYRDRVFQSTVTDPLSRFVLDARWADFDNTATGAADRIDYYLKHGVDHVIKQFTPIHKAEAMKDWVLRNKGNHDV